jgi:hypothetical protein
VKLKDMIRRATRRRTPADQVAADIVHHEPAQGIVIGIPTAVAPGVVAEAPKERKQMEAHVGMVGYAPHVTVTKARNGMRCKCGEVVVHSVRHVCMYNAHNHIDSMTEAERVRVIRQLNEASQAGTPRAEVERAAAQAALSPTRNKPVAARRQRSTKR